MKFNLLFIPLLFLFSCGQDPWSDDEKSYFMLGCKEDGGSKNYCECFMEKTMEAYPRYEESNNISFEEAVELSKDCE